MPVDAYGSDTWVVTHPALAGTNPNTFAKSKAVDASNFQMSYEFARFLANWNLGYRGRDEHYKRCFNIATRKSCYKGPILTPLGTFTQQGEEVLDRAKIYISRIHHFYAGLGITGTDVPDWDASDTMERIMCAGVFTANHMGIMRGLYNATSSEDPDDPHNPSAFGKGLPTDSDTVYQEHDGKTYLLTATYRNLTHQRGTFEDLVKFGLLDLSPLPKRIEQNGRGRHPIGATFTEKGKLFYQDFLSQADPERIAAQKMQMSYQRMRQDMEG